MNFHEEIQHFENKFELKKMKLCQESPILRAKLMHAATGDNSMWLYFAVAIPVLKYGFTSCLTERVVKRRRQPTTKYDNVIFIYTKFTNKCIFSSTLFTTSFFFFTLTLFMKISLRLEMETKKIISLRSFSFLVLLWS